VGASSWSDPEIEGLAFFEKMQVHGDIDTRIDCPRCGGCFTVRELLRAPGRAYRSLKVVTAHTPCCGGSEELWLRNGLASRGYLYAAGTAHFADMETYRAPGLLVDWGPQRVIVELEGACFDLPRE